MATAEAYLRAKFLLDPSNRLAAVNQRYRQTGHTGQTDRKRSDSTGRSVFTNGRPINNHINQEIANKITPKKN